MPSTSKSQQRLFGWALACKRGEAKNCPANVKKLADSMTEDELEDFASTKHEGLPEEVKEAIEIASQDLLESFSANVSFIAETLAELVKVDALNSPCRGVVISSIWQNNAKAKKEEKRQKKLILMW